MDIEEYFYSVQGKGVLATANSCGNVDAAVYALPHVMDRSTLAFIMADRMTHDNVRSNPYAVYLFIEENKQYQGKRFYLRMIKESEDMLLIDNLHRGRHSWPIAESYHPEKKFLVYFKIEKIRPLTGDAT